MSTGLVDIASEQAFDSFVAQNDFAVAYFWADWCAPCKQLDFVVAQLSSTYSSVKFARIEAENLSSITEKFSITSIPYFLFFKKGSVTSRVEGANPPELLKQTEALNKEASASTNTNEDVDYAKLVNQAPVMIFIKGSPEAPRCGFSGQLIQILKKNDIKFQSFDILQNEKVRAGLKTYSNWPTYPQVYAKGELVGGLDIIKELEESGELLETLGAKTEDLNTRLKKLIESSPVILFMKGTADQPKCGFSSQAIQLLRKHNINFSTFDILSDNTVREGLKVYSNWPTYPQLYSKGSLVGGLDIMKELEENDELVDAL